MSILIVGAGPNLGAAIARRFGREGMPVGLISRNQDKLNGSPRSSQRRGSPPTSSPPTSASRPRSHRRSGRWLTALAPSRCSSTPRCRLASSCSRSSRPASTISAPTWSSACSAPSPP